MFEALSDSYFDMHGYAVQVLDEPPSPLEFARLVRTSRPVIIRNAQTLMLLGRKWTDSYLSATMGNTPISVAVTPHGRADSVIKHYDGKKYFVEPHVQPMTMHELLCVLSSTDPSQSQEIHYLQSQNGNVYSGDSFSIGEGHDASEFQPLRADIPSQIPWCSEALGHPPDAANIWIGNEASVTSIHSDPYENIYQVVRGEKHFTLLPPTDSWALKERMWSHAKYDRPSGNRSLQLTPSPDGQSVRWSAVNEPNAPEVFPPQVHPIQVKLEAGDTLYLPAGYWHYVRQSGLTIALNYWYDVDMGSLSWQFVRFIRDSCEAPPAEDSSED